MSALEARRACEAVEVTVPGRPDYINDCNCSLCTKLGATLAYYAPEEIGIDEAVRRPDGRAWQR